MVNETVDTTKQNDDNYKSSSGQNDAHKQKAAKSNESGMKEGHHDSVTSVRHPESEPTEHTVVTTGDNVIPSREKSEQTAPTAANIEDVTDQPPVPTTVNTAAQTAKVAPEAIGTHQQSMYGTEVVQENKN